MAYVHQLRFMCEHANICTKTQSAAEVDVGFAGICS